MQPTFPSSGAEIRHCRGAGDSWVGARGQDPAGEFPPPEPITPVTLGPTLKTHAVRRTPNGFVKSSDNKATFNERWVDASLLPRDKEGIWVLDFAFKPVRMRTVEVPGKGRRQVHYLYYGSSTGPASPGCSSPSSPW